MAVRRVTSADRRVSRNTSRQAANQTIAHTSQEDLERVKHTFSELIEELQHVEVLPYNPYPWLAVRMGQIKQRSEVEDHSIETVKKLKANVTASTSVDYIVRPSRDCDFVWGGADVTRAVDPASLWRYKWLLSNVTPPTSDVKLPKNYSCQVIPALVGPAVFAGSFFKSTHNLHIRIQFVITGEDFNKGCKIFVEAILADIEETEKSKLQVLLSFYVPYKLEREDGEGEGEEEGEGGGGWRSRMWTYEDLASRKEELLKSMKAAVAGDQRITSQSLHCLDGEGRTYLRGQKVYWLTFIQLDHDAARDAPSGLTAVPLSTLHDGVFMGKSHVEAYMAIYHQAALSEGLEELEDRSKNLRRDAPSRVLIDGFRFSKTSKSGNAAVVKERVLNSWKSEIASEDLTAEPFQVLYQVLLVALGSLEHGSLRAEHGSHRAEHDSSRAESGSRAEHGSRAASMELFVEISNFAQSSAAQLYALMELNRSLRELLYKYEAAVNDIPVQVVTSLLRAYRQGLLEFFGNRKEKIQTSQEMAFYEVVNYRLKQIKDSSAVSTASLTMKTLRILKDLNSYIYSKYLSLITDSLSLCPQIQDYVAWIKSTTPVDSSKRAAYKFMIRVSDGARLEKSLQKSYRHGNENRNKATEYYGRRSNQESRTSSRSSSFQNYMRDTELNTAWQRFLDHNGSPQIKDPYSHLITTLRLSAVRREFWSESDDDILNERIHWTQDLVCVDKKNFIYNVQGTKLYGLKSALRTVDSMRILEIFNNTEPYFHTDFKQTSGHYKVAVCTCLYGGEVGLFGSIDPYLTSIELHEHCFTSGPSGCTTDAIQLYVSICLTNLEKLHENGECVIQGVSLGDKMMNFDEIIQRKRGFPSTMEHCIANKQPVCLKFFIEEDWRMVPVIKRYLFHFLCEDDDTDDIIECTSWFELNHLDIYRYIFADLDRAKFYWQQCGLKSDPLDISNKDKALKEVTKQMSECKKRTEWLEIFRLISSKCSISEDFLDMVLVWRVLQSVSRRLDYVIQLGVTLRDLIYYTLNTEASEHDRAEHLDHVEQTMGEMLTALIQKTDQVLNEPCAMTPLSVREAVLAKLDSIADVDDETSDLFIDCQLKSIMILDEALEMIRAVYDASVFDMFITCQSITPDLSNLPSVQSPTSNHPGSTHPGSPPERPTHYGLPATEGQGRASGRSASSRGPDRPGSSTHRPGSASGRQGGQNKAPQGGHGTNKAKPGAAQSKQPGRPGSGKQVRSSGFESVDQLNRSVRRRPKALISDYDVQDPEGL